MRMKAKTGWCCVLCGVHLGGQMCDNENGIITCPDEDCIGQYERQLKKNRIKKLRK